MIQAEPPQQAPPPPVPEEQTTSPWAGRAARARSFWNGGVTFAHDVGEWPHVGAVIEAKFENGLKGNPLSEYMRHGAKLKMALMPDVAGTILDGIQA